jgi:hypothetical protein
MFEPLLGLLTRGYVAGKARRGADFGLRLTCQGVVKKVMGLCSNPCRRVAGWSVSATTRGRSGCRDSETWQDLKAQSSERSR